MNLSVQGFHRVQKPARTIADLAGGEPITAAHVAESLQAVPGSEAQHFPERAEKTA